MSEDKSQYNYDIAISFLQQDGPIALDLNNHLCPNFNVFVYTNRQEDLAGTNGIDVFRRVFLENSRFVVVLYREGWGDTRWTRIEEDAIKERFLNEGWDWLLFIMVDSISTPPPWLPDRKIRLNLEEYGIEQAVGAIKKRVQELGGVYHKEDVLQHAKRIQRLAEERAAKNKLFKSHEGVNAASDKVRELYEIISNLSEDMKKIEGLNFNAGSENDLFVLTNNRVSVKVFFRCNYVNSLENARLLVIELNGTVLLPQEASQFMIRKKPEELNVQEFDPDITLEKGWCWRSISEPNCYYTSKELAEYAIKVFLDLVERADKGEIPPLEYF
jgi:hypothetical protein